MAQAPGGLYTRVGAAPMEGLHTPCVYNDELVQAGTVRD